MSQQQQTQKQKLPPRGVRMVGVGVQPLLLVLLVKGFFLLLRGLADAATAARSAVLTSAGLRL
jgi:hypothetical protein